MSALAKTSPATGLFVAIVGPSGAGKDALIRGLAGRLGEGDGVFCARRVVTRRADAFEDHDTLAEDEFLAARAQGRFALAWSAAWPPLRCAMRNRGAACGRLRSRLQRFARRRRRAAPTLSIVARRARPPARPETLAARLAARGREDGASRRERLDRAAVAELAFAPDATIDNDGALDEAVARLCDLVVSALRSAAR